MNEFDEILEIAGSNLVQLSKKFEDDWGKKLRFGHTDWVIRHDMLGEGHQNLIPPARYFQAIRELYGKADNMIENESLAMEAQADLIDAKQELEGAVSDSECLRAKAKIKRYSNRLKNYLLMMKDQEKEMKCLYSEMKELEPEIKAKYDCDIEKAQHDIWLSRYRYALGTGDRINNKPLPENEKLHLAMERDRKDQMAIAEVRIGYERDWEERVRQFEANENNRASLGNKVGASTQ